MFTARPEITGVDIGPRYVDGKRTKKTVLRVHVREKRPESRLTESERVPREIFGIPTDVIAGHYRRHAGTAGAPTGRFNPIRPGISVGSAKAETGTLGIRVYDDETGDPCLLGSYHVLAGPNGAQGDPITQPGRFDGGVVPADTVATLHRFFLPGPWGDAAVARLTNDRQFDNDAVGSNASIAQAEVPTSGMQVEKSGRTTGVTRGRIEALGTYFYDEVPSGVNGFLVVPDVDHPNVPDLSAPGDSGSVYYLRGTNVGVGIHCAGLVDPALGEIAIACSLPRVLATLRVSLTK